MGISKWNLAATVERVVSNEVLSRTHDRWDENSITFELVKHVRATLDGVEVDDARDRASISARVFKARGAIETQFGDLAVHLSFHFHDGTALDGVAFYEAKVRDWSGPKLPSANKKQLERINKNLWNPKILVYDREPILSQAYEALICPDSRVTVLYPLIPGEDLMVVQRERVDERRLPFTHAAVVPMGAALALAKFDTSLYRFAVPFSHQLCLRNLTGLDLEHDKEIIAGVRGQSTKYDVPAIVLSLAIQVGPGDGAPQGPAFNEQLLEQQQDRPS